MIRDLQGRRWVEITTADWLGERTEHAPTAAQLKAMRFTPYDVSGARKIREDQAPRVEPVDDDKLADAEAIRLARLEQKREPADLLSGVA